MNGRVAWHYAALIGAATLIVGCGPDTPERGTATESRSRRQPALAQTNPASRPPRRAATRVAPRSVRRRRLRAPRLPAARLRRRRRRGSWRGPRCIRSADNTARGIVEFQTAAGGDGPLTIHVVLMGVDAGPHGMHIHSGTDCAAPGEHLNPQNAPHGAANAGAAARHLGDLGNITADASGVVEEMLRDAQLGSDSTFIGKVIIVHKGQDDLSTQPGGDSGDPIACGVIEPAGEDVISRSGDANRGV